LCRKTLETFMKVDYIVNVSCVVQGAIS
jgi:hypothetical protein